MIDKMRYGGNDICEEMLNTYKINTASKGKFLLQVDWLLENAVYPTENSYAENLMDLWNVYMPEYEFNIIVLEYSKKYFPILRYVHDKLTHKFNSIKVMQECAIKNYIKYCIAQGKTNRMDLLTACFDLLKEVSDRNKLYDVIKRIIENYFSTGDVEQYSAIFLKRFQDYSMQPYVEIIERMRNINIEKKQRLTARINLFESLRINNYEPEEFYSLLNVLLCRISLSDGELRFSDVLKNSWKLIFPEIPYNEQIYTYIEKYEKPYMSAGCYGIKNIENKKFVEQLYKDAVILSSVLDSFEKGKIPGLKNVNDFWRNYDVHFAGRLFFDEEYERMKPGFNSKILLEYKNDIISFHKLLLNKIENISTYAKYIEPESRKNRSSDDEISIAALSDKDRKIKDLQEKISELEEKIDNKEKEVLSAFISLLDSKKYDHVLGKLYRIAYAADVINIEDIRSILKNLFEIMNISGIDIYGDLGSSISLDEIKKGKYRLDHEISSTSEVKYPGYRLGDSVILHPIAEEM